MRMSTDSALSPAQNSIMFDNDPTHTVFNAGAILREIDINGLDTTIAMLNGQKAANLQQAQALGLVGTLPDYNQNPFLTSYNPVEAAKLTNPWIVS